jgi:hypothetical protein
MVGMDGTPNNNQLDASIEAGVRAVAEAVGKGLAPASPRAVPDGWVLVPREPTVEMKEAAEGFNYSYDLDDAWHLMLAAVPPIDAPDSKP